jgi:hypothetical protein
MANYFNTIICYGFRVVGDLEPSLLNQDVIYYRDLDGTYLISMEDYYKVPSIDPVITNEDMIKGFMTTADVATAMGVYELILTPSDDTFNYFQKIGSQIGWWIVEYTWAITNPPYMGRKFSRRLPIQVA